MNLEDWGNLGEVGGLVALLFIAWQLREQIRRTRNDAYYSAVNLMISHWHKLNKVMSPEFHEYSKWREEERQQADEVCLLLHQLGAAVQQKAIPPEICDVYFYTIPTLRKKLDSHIQSRRDSENVHYRSESYYWAFDELAELVCKRNEKAKRKIRE